MANRWWLSVVAVACLLLVHDWNVAESVRSLSNNDNSSPLGLIHLGKCGGMTLIKTLQNNTTTPRLLGRPVVRYHVTAVPVERHDDWIGLVRHPVERLRSSWVFSHPDNAPWKKNVRPHLYKYHLYECYPTLSSLLTDLATQQTTTNNNKTCLLLAKQLFRDDGPDYGYGMYHFRYNYRHYYRRLLEQASAKRIFVIRNEHMLHDLNRIEAMLGGTANFGEMVPHSHFKRAVLPRDKDTSASLQGTTLCDLLCAEMAIYKQLYRVAINLDDKDDKDMMQSLELVCPNQTPLCPTHHLVDMTPQEQEQLHEQYNQQWDPFNTTFLRQQRIQKRDKQLQQQLQQQKEKTR